jgi:hypothetical protein
LQAGHFEALAGHWMDQHAIPRNHIRVGDDLFRNSRKGVRKSFVRTQTLQKDEHQNIGSDQQIINYRSRTAIGIVISDWK